MALPPALAAALTTAISGLPARDLTAAAKGLSARYREQRGSFLRGAADVTAYAAFRLPATYAATMAALSQVRAAEPDLRPTSLLDLGAGPGTGAWAACAVWPEIQHITFIERDPHMLALGKELAAAAPSFALRDATWRPTDITGDWQVEPADLVIAAYTLGELPPEQQPGFPEKLWRHALQTGVIIEPGTPQGWRVVEEASRALATLGAHIVAPAPIAWDCLAGRDDWLHFAARVARTRLHRSVKGADLSYEDEKFSYVAGSRLPAQQIAARVIRRPQIRSGHIRLTVCTPEGVREIVVTRTHREAFRRAKDLRWGDAIGPEEAEVFGLPSTSDQTGSDPRHRRD
ncbi:MAG TPA: small ribosomal subunit Rsm22 family protein [Chloroflexota bacterium]|nr:small ribosomal subunit Rsm22 family protein [Chloroflexota bacterium]